MGIKKGDQIRIKPEWQDAGDDQIVFVAVSDEEKGRVDIQPQLGLKINPIQTVEVSMIEKVAAE